MAQNILTEGIVIFLTFIIKNIFNIENKLNIYIILHKINFSFIFLINLQII